jgi:type II secretory pathway component PulL
MIGFIDWTEEKITIHTFNKKGRQYTLADTVSVPVEGKLDNSALIPLAKPGIERIHLSVPVNLLTIRELSFPFSNKNKIKDTIPYELEAMVLGNVSEYSIDYIIKDSSASADSSALADKSASNTQVLAVCIEKTKLQEILDLFSSAGLEPMSVTSIDLRFSIKNIEMLFESSSLGEKIRAEAAREDLANPLINLRQDEFAYKGDIDRIKNSIRFTAVLASILLLLLGLDLTLKLTALKKENTLLANEINTLYRKTFPDEKKIVDAIRQFKGNFNVISGKKAVLGGVPVLDTMLNIANLKNRNITLDEFSADDEKIIIKGSGSSFENVDAFKNTLASSFKEIKIIDSEASPDKKIRFSIIMKEKTP